MWFQRYPISIYIYISGCFTVCNSMCISLSFSLSLALYITSMSRSLQKSTMPSVIFWTYISACRNWWYKSDRRDIGSPNGWLPPPRGNIPKHAFGQAGGNCLNRAHYQVPSLKLTFFAPEHGWLEDEFPFGMAQFQGQTVSFREGMFQICRLR